MAKAKTPPKAVKKPAHSNSKEATRKRNNSAAKFLNDTEPVAGELTMVVGEPQTKAAQRQIPRPHFIEIDRRLIRLNPDNPRHFVDDQKFRELVTEVQAAGTIHTPIAVRRETGNFPEDFRIIYGERRFRALDEIGAEKVPCMFYEDITDDEAYALTLSENLQRQDITPLEESQAVNELAARGWTYEQIADRFGKGVQWVGRRAGLINLIDIWKEHLNKREANWPTETYRLIALLSPTGQENCFKMTSDQYNLKPSEVQKMVERTVEDEVFTDKRWNEVKENAEGVKQCSNCGGRAGVSEFLFDDMNKKQDYCYNKTCLNERIVKFIVKTFEKKLKKYPNLQLVRWYSQTDPEYIVGHVAAYDGNLKIHKGSEKVPAHYLPYMYIDNPEKFGDIIWAIPRAQDEEERRSTSSSKTKEETPQQKLDKKIMQHRKLRCRIVSNKIIVRIEELINVDLEQIGLTAIDHIAGYHYGLVDNVQRAAELLLFKLLAVFGTHKKEDSQWGESPWKNEMLGSDNGMPVKHMQSHMIHLYQSVLKALRDRVKFNDEPHYDDIIKVSELLLLPLDQFWLEAVREKPYPKSWADDAYKRQVAFNISDSLYPRDIPKDPHPPQPKVKLVDVVPDAPKENQIGSIEQIHPDLIPEDHELDDDGNLLPQFVEKYALREQAIANGTHVVDLGVTLPDMSPDEISEDNEFDEEDRRMAAFVQDDEEIYPVEEDGDTEDIE